MEIANREFYKSKLLSRIKYENDCWLWTGSVNDDGYGNIWIGKSCKKTHRVSYILFKGDIPDKMCVCHKCDKRSCINPEHLWIGTHKDNMNDMVNKGRTLYAEQRKNNKIPRALYLEIVNKYLSGQRQTQLAKEYNCHSTTIWNAIHKIVPINKIDLKGEKHPYAKLTEGIVKMIRKYKSEGLSTKEIALKYNISTQLVNRINKRLIWKHI